MSDLEKEIAGLQAQHSVPPPALPALDDLEFQDGSSGQQGLSGQIGAPDTASMESSGLISPPAAGASAGGSPPSGPNAGTPAMLSLEGFKPYFNVTTVVVQERLRKSVFPFKQEKLLVSSPGPDGDGEDVVQDPDLYGMFWVATSLVFLMGVFGNMASFLSFTPTAAEPTWRYNFEKITFAAAVMYGYVTMVPTLIWCVLRYQGIQRLSADRLLCIYGYSLTVFIPVCVLCVLPFESVRWVLVMSAFGVSCFFLYVNLFKDLLATQDLEQPSKVICGVAAALHLLLALAFKIYFFEYAQISELPIGAAPASSSAHAAAGPAPAPSSASNGTKLRF